jgi:hypothetical protein
VIDVAAVTITYRSAHRRAEASEMSEQDAIVGTWQVEAIGDEDVLAAPVPTLTFAADGTVSGSGGVNCVTGPYRIEATIELGPLAATQMGASSRRWARSAGSSTRCRGASRSPSTAIRSSLATCACAEPAASATGGARVG